MDINYKILLAEDDEGHATLIKKNLKRSGLLNEIIHFKDGEETLNYLFQKGKRKIRTGDTHLILLLDIKMPKIDGFEVLAKIKEDPELKKMPVFMITTTADPAEVERCYSLGCSTYINKPIDYEKFVGAIRILGLFLFAIEVPLIRETVKDESRAIKYGMERNGRMET